jgi:F0F1-type ATP synthase epsilon subunit
VPTSKTNPQITDEAVVEPHNKILNNTYEQVNLNTKEKLSTIFKEEEPVLTQILSVTINAVEYENA